MFNVQIIENTLTINDTGIEILNNKSKVIDNNIEKSFENGIKIVGNDNHTRSMPSIWKNKIFSCGYNGIMCQGEFCEPDIRGNTIDSNIKAGIKLTENSVAHIGGTNREDLSIFLKNLPLAFHSTAGGPTSSQLELTKTGVPAETMRN